MNIFTTRSKSQKLRKAFFSAFLIVSLVLSQAALPLTLAYAQTTEEQTPIVETQEQSIPPVQEETQEETSDFSAQRFSLFNNHNEDKVNICHATSSQNNPWNAIQINSSALSTHTGHGDFTYGGPLKQNGKPANDGDDWCKNHVPTPPAPTATISAKKVVCDSEADLPNWGIGGSNITATTASDYVALKAGKCHLADWTFEYGTGSNPGDNVAVGGAGWTAFASTATVPANQAYWVREQTQPGYVPFSGATSDHNSVAAKNSAELYCDDDVYNYDNYDHTQTTVAGQTYHCVGFNALAAPQCNANASADIVSDSSTKVGADNSAELSFVHSAWVNIPGAKWIWATDPVQTVSETDVTKVFTKTFTITGTPTGGSLQVAADNNYTLKVNGTTVPVVFDQDNFSAIDTYNVLPLLVTGANTLEFTVTNWGVGQSTDPAANPAGLLYKLSLTNDECVTPPPPVDVCLNMEGVQTQPPAGYVIKHQNDQSQCVPEFVEVNLCKVDDKQTPLPGWELTLTGASVGSVNVLPNGSDFSIFNVPAGNYLLKASGQYTYRGTAGAEYSDAAYSKRDAGDAVYQSAALNPVQSPFLPWVRENDFPTPNTGWLGVIFNNAFTDWGSAFNPSHVYTSPITTGATSDLSFKILDDVYADNSGSINVGANKYYKGVTEQNGCVAFENIPYGDYTVGEIMQPGWSLVSLPNGDGNVQAYNETQTFTIVNHNNEEIQCKDEPAPIVKEFGFVCNDSGVGQNCLTDYSTNVVLSENGTVDLDYTVPGGHCSAVKVHTYIDNVLVSSSGFFGWSGDPMSRPMNGALLDDYALSAGSHTISLKAEGEVGGCNTGTLYSWGGTLNIDTQNSCNEVAPVEGKVHLLKVVDGVQATSQMVNGVSFPMNTPTYGNAPFTLGPNGWTGGDAPYEASTSTIAAGGTYTANENLTTALVGASCTAENHPAYELVGYSTGSTLNNAKVAPVSLTAPTVTVNGDQYIIVWNKKCGEVEGAHTLKVHLYKYLKSGNSITQVPNDSTAPSFPMTATWQTANLNGGVSSSAPYVLGDYHGGASMKYAADTSPMEAPANYTTSEVTSAESDFLPTDAQCVPGKYRLLGYRSSAVSLENAETMPLVSLAPNFANITSDRWVIVENEKCADLPPPPATGSIEITKYTCPANFVPNRTTNGVGSVVPEGCTLTAGTAFGYVHGDATDANGPYPELDATPTPGGVTAGNGKLVIGPVLSAGRYLIKETDATNLAGLYCQGDGDTNPNNNDNQELTFVPANGVTKCVAYNKVVGGGGETFTSDTTVVTPSAMNGWAFIQETATGSGAMVSGPATAPLGTGSAQLTVDSTGGEILAAVTNAGVRLDKITTLSYDTYRVSGSPALALALQFEFDNNLTDADTAYKGRMVYEPYHTQTVSNATWQTWNALNDAAGSGTGNWWFSNGTMATASGCSMATPCTWAEVKAAFPDGGIRSAGGTTGGTFIKAGGGWTGGFVGSVDKLVIGVKTGLNTHTQTYDFEPAAPEVCSAGSYTDLSDNSGAIRFENSQGYNTGSINGVNGWSATGAYDYGVVANTYGYASFDNQAFRISDGITSGSFGDWAFATPNANGAGEASATNGAFSRGILQNHFEAQFDIASTRPCAQQEGLHFSVSPDRGDGSRMSYLRFEDGASGLNVFFDDVIGTETTNGDVFNETQIATGLSRSIPHKVKFVMDFVNGPSNDVVTIYIDGVAVHTGTSWENYYRYDSESASEQTPRIVKTLIFQARGTAHPANTGKGYLVDNLTLGSSIPAPLCSDGIDNDGDGFTDFPADLGCSSASDNDETTPVQTFSRGGGGGGGGMILPAAPKGSVLGASTQCGLYLDDFLKMGKKNNKDEVKKLQTFLNDYLKLSPKISVNGIFGIQTYKAVLKFQEQESDYILKPWVGITLKTAAKGTGWVYKTTVTRINNIMCPELNLQTPPLTID